MTDTLTEGIPDQFDASPPGYKPCAQNGCDRSFDATGAGGHFRKYCDDHQPPKKAAKGKRKPPADKPPTSINVNLGNKAKSKDKELDAVEDRARQLVQVLAALVLLAGQPEDAADIERGAPALSKSLRELAEYEDWLRKLAQGGDTTGRAMAWIQFAVALIGMLMPILLRHGALPAGIMGMAETAFQMGGTPPPVPADAPAAA